MTDLIITKQVDELGRIAIPAVFIKDLQLNIKNDIKAFISLPDKYGIITVDVNSSEPSTIIQAKTGYMVVQHRYDLKPSTFDIWIENGKLKLRKTVPECILSGEITNLIRYKNTDKYISRKVIVELYLKDKYDKEN